MPLARVRWALRPHAAADLSHRRIGHFSARELGPHSSADSLAAEHTESAMVGCVSAHVSAECRQFVSHHQVEPSGAVGRAGEPLPGARDIRTKGRAVRRRVGGCAWVGGGVGSAAPNSEPVTCHRMRGSLLMRCDLRERKSAEP